MTYQEQTYLSRCAHFKRGDFVFQEGEERNHTFIIESGSIGIMPGKETSKDNASRVTLGPGEIFGEMAILSHGQRTATAVALEDTELFMIPRQVLQERITNLDPLVALLMSLLVDRYRSLRIKHAEIADLQPALPAIEEEQDEEENYEPITTVSNLNVQKENALKELRVEQELRKAIEKKQFVAYMQPILSLDTGKIAGFETLIRWIHPERGIVPPLEFIPVAERTNVVQLLDRLMFEQACYIAPELNALTEGKVEKLFVSVNLSGINFEDEDIVDSVKRCISKTKVDPSLIKLEITESALIGDSKQAEEVLRGFKALGLHIALDDFGTGYSSLSYLHKFSIDTLKIDRSFVSQIRTDTKTLDILRAIVDLSGSFKFKVVAEGIEYEEEADMLKKLGCDYGQGYLYGRPLSIEDARQFIKTNLDL